MNLIPATLLAIIEICAVMSYFVVAVMAWARSDGRQWWALRVAMSFQCISASAITYLAVKYTAVIPNEWASWIAVVATLLGAVTFFDLGFQMWKHIRLALRGMPHPLGEEKS